MAKLTRLVPAVLIACLAAATAASASTLRVTTWHGDITVATTQDAAVYRTTVFVPESYVLHAQAKLDGRAVVHADSPSGPLTFTGWIEKSYPQGWVEEDCASDLGYRHLAVWLLEVRQVNGLARAEIPVFVDPGPRGTTALTWCASSAADMTVTGVSITLDPVFAAPVRHGAYTWSATFDNGTTTEAAAVVHE